FADALFQQPVASGGTVRQNAIGQGARQLERTNLRRREIHAGISNRSDGYRPEGQPSRGNRKNVRIPAISVNDIHPPRSDISGKAQLIQNTPAGIKAALGSVLMNWNFGAQTLEQWSGAV